MDLKEFINETVAAIVEATSELQAKYESLGVVVNPPVTNKERDLYRAEDSRHQYRRVEVVNFDVAVTAATDSAGGGKAGLRVWGVEANLDGTHSRKNEAVSRVSFSIPLVLSPTKVEGKNRELAEQEQAEAAVRRANTPPSSSWLNR